MPSCGPWAHRTVKLGFIGCDKRLALLLARQHAGGDTNAEMFERAVPERDRLALLGRCGSHCYFRQGRMHRLAPIWHRQHACWGAME